MNVPEPSMTNRPNTLLLPQAAQYGLRALACLAQLGGDDLFPRDDLATLTHMPSAYAAKILQQLARAGIVHAQRGRGGGFRLAKPPERIPVIDVLRALDCEPRPDHCAFGYAVCDAHMPCPLHAAWEDLRNRVLEWAAETTVADLHGQLR